MFSFLIVSCSEYKKKTTKETTIRLDSIALKNGGSVISVNNNGKKNLTFQIKLNTGFYMSEEDICEEIENLKKEIPDISNEKSAWIFVMKNIAYKKPFSEQRWQHNPLLLINSIGSGQCDDMASLLAYLWKKLGYESRVWSLNGHVVPEVFAGGKWQMFDPAFQVYYLNTSGNVASVEEIAGNISMISDGAVKEYSNNVLSEVISGSTYLKEIYATRTDNNVNEWYDYFPDSVPHDFVLPAKSKFEFPLQLPCNPKCFKGGFFPDYSIIQLSLAENTKADIKIPLVIFDIQGNGTVNIDNQNFEIGSAELATYVRKTKNFISELKISEKNQNVVIRYLFNSQHLKDLNSISLTGYNVNDIDITAENRKKEKENLPINIDSVILNYYTLAAKRNLLSYYNNKKDLKEELKIRIEKLILSDTVISVAIKRKRIETVSKHLETLNSNLDSIGAETLYKKLLHPELMIVFLSYSQFLTTEELINALE